MSRSRLKRKLTRSWEAYRVVVYSILGAGTLGFFYYFLTTIGPRSVGSSGSAPVKQMVSSDNPEVLALSFEVDRLEKEYQQAAAAGLVTAETLQILEQAVQKQRTLILTYPTGSHAPVARLSGLEAELDSARAASLVTRIDQLQKDGEAALQAEKFESASELLNEALALQREINASNAHSRYKNYVKETSLIQTIAAIDATPLFNEKQAAVKSAKLAVSEERWGDALAAYIRARDLQQRINREYPKTRYADLGGFDRLESEIASLNSAGVAAEIDAKEAAGDAKAKSGDHSAAAKLYAEAFTLQQEVNLKYTRSRFVSSARLERLDGKQQSATARPLTDRLQAIDREISADLAARRVVAAEQRIPDAAALLERITKEFPKGDFQLGELKIKLAYLSLKRADLRSIQDDVYDQLLPLPGASVGLLMFKTEVTQQLYAQVMNTNPSRNPGRAFPVDSVNWNDVEEFCTRMNWILGLPVRLPTVDEFRVAIGDISGRIVSVDSNVDRPVAAVNAEPNTNGFIDLLGNVAEWLDAGQIGNTAPVGGGSYLDRETTLRSVPTENRPRIDRARQIGFRFIVSKPETR